MPGYEYDNVNRRANAAPVNGQVNQHVSSNINYDNLF